MTEPFYTPYNEEQVFSGLVFDVVRHAGRFMDRVDIQRDLVAHRGSAVIIPELDDGRLVVLRQFRLPVGEEILEFPAGTCEIDEDPHNCASRELVEEAGVSAARLDYLGCSYPSPGYCTEKMFFYHARELTPAKGECDPDEFFTIESYAVDEMWNMITNGIIMDGKTIIGMSLLKKGSR